MIEIPLNNNKIALVDDEDYELVSQFSWYALCIDKELQDELYEYDR